MAVWAGETHFVDVGESALFPGHDVMYFAALRVGGATCAMPVTGDDGFDLSFVGESAIASYPDGLAFAVKDNSGHCCGTHQAFEHCLG